MCCMCDDMIVVGINIGVHDNQLYGDMWLFKKLIDYYF